MANLAIMDQDQGGKKEFLHPVYYVRDNQSRLEPDTSNSIGLILKLMRITDSKHLEIGVKETAKVAPMVALKVLKFPFINLVWLGVLVMLVGIVMSILRRVKLTR